MALSSLIFFGVALLIWLLTRWMDRRLVLLHLFTSFWASQYVWLMPAWSLQVRGREKIPRNQPLVMVSNHQSLLDILVAFNLFVPFKWVSKIEIFKLPFIGWNMSLNRYIGLDRGNKESRKKMLHDCELALQQGSSVYLFPEGTRSHTGELKAFKPGAFILAHKQQVAIQPIVINGTQDALPKKSLNFHGFHRITLEVLDPIPYADFAHLSVEETAVQVREQIAARVASLRAEAGPTAEQAANSQSSAVES